MPFHSQLVVSADMNFRSVLQYAVNVLRVPHIIGALATLEHMPHATALLSARRAHGRHAQSAATTTAGA